MNISTASIGSKESRDDINQSPQKHKTQTAAPQGQKFGSNLCAVLNDPRKDRTKTSYLFTKTWGSDFVDTVQVPSITNVHTNSKNQNKYRPIKLNEFRPFLDEFSEVKLQAFYSNLLYGWSKTLIPVIKLLAQRL
jgi:hypothetical protein